MAARFEALVIGNWFLKDKKEDNQFQKDKKDDTCNDTYIIYILSTFTFNNDNVRIVLI